MNKESKKNNNDKKNKWYIADREGNVVRETKGRSKRESIDKFIKSKPIIVVGLDWKFYTKKGFRLRKIKGNYYGT